MTKQEWYLMLRRCWKLQEILGEDLLITIKLNFDYTKEMERYKKISNLTKIVEYKFIKM